MTLWYFDNFIILVDEKKIFFKFENKTKPTYEKGNAYFWLLKYVFIYIFFWKTRKVANRKFGNLGNLENLGNVIQSFLISEFSILPYSKNRKHGLWKHLKIFSRFPVFLNFRPDHIFPVICCKGDKMSVCLYHGIGPYFAVDFN